MMILGRTYFWKFLETCDPALLDETAEALRSAFSETMGDEYILEQSDSEKIQRWSKGCFNEPGEQDIRFPRVSLSYHRRSGNRDPRWIAFIFFTRIPHIEGVYINKDSDHILAPSVERKLSTRLLESYLADAFTRANDKTLAGTTAGLYVYQKVRQITALKNHSEDSKYTPPGSELKELLQSLPAVLPEGGPSSQVIEVPDKRTSIREFLSACDGRVSSSLGNERLRTLLQPAEVSEKEWLNAGRQGLLKRLLPV